MPTKPPKIFNFPKREINKGSWGGDTAKYRRASWINLRDAHRNAYPLCVKCEKEGRAVSILNNGGVVDHIEPEKVAPDRFLDPTNLQSLCHKHHNQKTAKENK
jgi:5-methylcytosine-specific restriction protein A